MNDLRSPFVDEAAVLSATDWRKAVGKDSLKTCVAYLCYNLLTTLRTRGGANINILNKTIIVHSGVDDYTSQPSGNSGERIDCGLISIRSDYYCS